MEISHPTQPEAPTPPPHSATRLTGQPLDAIPEEDEVPAQPGMTSASASSQSQEDSAALSVGCALLLELGFEETASSAASRQQSSGDIPGCHAMHLGQPNR